MPDSRPGSFSVGALPEVWNDLPLLHTDAAAADVVMVVDDNPANLRLMEEMLRPRGYEVRSFPAGRMALTAAGNRAPDLILLDVNMPEMTGYEVCERLKSTATLCHIPVIFLS